MFKIEFVSDEVSLGDSTLDSLAYQKRMPEEGQRVLALYKGEWIVLEVGVESPSYEEPYFPPFKYWFEPLFNMLAIEYDDVTEWRELPDKE